MTGLDLRGPAGAIFSANREHRWLLWRRWADASETDRWLMVCGLNPSRADEVRSDPTVSQMVNRGKVLGRTGLLMANAYGVVGTYPSILKRHPDPVGPENMKHLLEAASIADMIVCAWGMLAGVQGTLVKEMLQSHGHKLFVFAETKDGSPRHPRGLSLSHMPTEWT